MGLRKYVRQVRPIQENHINHVRKVQTLFLMKQLKKEDIFKRESNNIYFSRNKR